MAYFEDSEKFVGCDIELKTDYGQVFRGPIKSIEKENGQMIFKVFWMASLDYLEGWTKTNRFKNNAICFVICEASAVESLEEGKLKKIRTRIIELQESVSISLFSKELGQLDCENVHTIDCPGKCLGCVKADDFSRRS